MAPENQPALEREEEVLPHRGDPLEAPPVDSLGDAQDLRARVARLDRERLADERLEVRRSSMKRVTLGHGATVALARLGADDLALEHAHALRRPVQGVAFGHPQPAYTRADGRHAPRPGNHGELAALAADR